MDIGKLRVDSAKIEAGVWVGDIPEMGELRLKVRGFSSASYRTSVQKAQRAVPRGELNKDGTMPVSVSDRVGSQAMQEAALLDWAGLEQDGKPVPYDPALALTLLTDPDFRSFRDAVVYAGNEVDRIKKDAEALVVGNSQTSLSGTSPGALTPTASLTPSTTAA